MRIEILKNRRTNRPNGDGHVYFKSMDEITEAMKYDRKYMGKHSLVLFFFQITYSLDKRYIELYFDSPRPSNRRRNKSNDHSSPSPSKSIDNRSPSRSIPRFLFFFLFDVKSINL